MSEYDDQATRFCEKFGVRVRITEGRAICPPWADAESKSDRAACSCGSVHGDHYRITISIKGRPGRLAFDFWGSYYDMQKGEDPTVYDVLSCVSSDAYCPDSFDDFCGEYGYDTASRKAIAQFKRCDRFARRIRAFFTEEEIDALSEIQ